VLRYAHLHAVIIILGFTGILGRLIHADAVALVWHRMWMAAVVLLGLALWRRSRWPGARYAAIYLGIGVLVALHWLSFFASVKIASVSIALVTFATVSAFTALIEPLVFKRRVAWYELLLGGITIVSMAMIFHTESRHLAGIVLGLASAFFAAWFSVLNARFTHSGSAVVMAAVEMLGGWALLSVVLLASGHMNLQLVELPPTDWGWLLILAVLCTGYAFAAMVALMRVISAFSVNLSLSLEPVYGMSMAAWLFGAEERLGLWAYAGLALLLAAIGLDLWLKQRLPTPGSPLAGSYH